MAVGPVPGQLQIVTTPLAALFALAFTGSVFGSGFQEEIAVQHSSWTWSGLGFHPTWLAVTFNIAIWGGIYAIGVNLVRAPFRRDERPVRFVCRQPHAASGVCIIPKSRWPRPHHTDDAQSGVICRSTGNPLVLPEEDTLVRHHQTTILKTRPRYRRLVQSSSAHLHPQLPAAVPAPAPPPPNSSP